MDKNGEQKGWEVKMGKLKLYVWEDVLCDWTCGLAVILAHDEVEARRIMKEKFPDYVTEELPFSKCKVVTEPDAFYIYGGG